jgi:hypothetical protein
MNTIRFGALPSRLSRQIQDCFANLSFCLLLFAVLPARANVCATHIQVNGGNGNGDTAPGGLIRVNFILNEAATAGTTVRIFSGANLVRAITIPAGGWGALRGQNTVLWDLKDTNGVIVPYGNYSVSVTAASLGFAAWTQITSDANSGNYVFAPRGIAVNQNTNSPYYGRVFVSNTTTGPHQATTPGDRIGILKLNADGSPAEEGEYSDGGYLLWQGGTRSPYSPWKIAVSDDDYFYANDWSANGYILRFDQTISPGSFLQVLRGDNWGNNGEANLTGPAVTGAGTNTQIWMADVNSPLSLGILKYGVTPNGDCATNDTGTVVVGLGGDMNLPPWGVAVDKQGAIYAIQQVDNPDDPNPRVLRFPPYDPSTNSGVPEINADWAVGVGDFRMCGAYGVAADPTGAYVAAAFQGTQTPSGYTNGQTVVFFATNGLIATNIITGSTNDHTDVCFDNVGNLYDLDNAAHIWRAYSPPGPNQSTTTPSGQTIRVLAVPYITSVVSGDTNVLVNFDAPLTNTASQFFLQSAPALGGFLTDVTATVIQINPGLFQAATGPGGSNQFYRIRRQ